MSTLSRVNSVKITQPPTSPPVPSPVTVSGTCHPPDLVVTVSVSEGTTSKGKNTVTASGTTWSTSFTLTSGMNYTATASVTGDSDTSPFGVK